MPRARRAHRRRKTAAGFGCGEEQVSFSTVLRAGTNLPDSNVGHIGIHRKCCVEHGTTNNGAS